MLSSVLCVYIYIYTHTHTHKYIYFASLFTGIDCHKFKIAGFKGRCVQSSEAAKLLSQIS